jgi:hypothetical protein
MTDDVNAPKEIWVVCGCMKDVGPDYVCTYRQGAMEHAALVSESANELGPWTVHRYVLASEAEALIAEEREACAKVCDTMDEAYERTIRNEWQDGHMLACDDCAAAIRARGGK